MPLKKKAARPAKISGRAKILPGKKARPSWEKFFIDLARMVSTRSTCLRRQVGAVVVRDKRILATGYNGAPSGMEHCDQVGCIRERLKVPSGERHEICRAIHAEQNAIIQAATFGVSLAGGTIYITHHPCVLCSKMLINSGIKKVVYQQGYPDELSRLMLKEAKLKTTKCRP
ncbi:MAG: cytidine/deoxycytidylate deaminase family protein [Candidatus Edwardsbacteria bacterium]|nr:cytidine/deoxycytidylate deaminase family protein [Candidatus Edwardsbacteria bacterium]